jgi:hypothetical protein
MPERFVHLHHIASLPHQHCCLSLRCGGRVWTCSAPACIAPAAQNSCQVCMPDGAHTTPPIRHPVVYSVWE